MEVMHTPGPWKVLKSKDKLTGMIVTVDLNGPIICYIPKLNIDNANLIAAAPDLLEAAKHTRFILANMQYYNGIFSLLTPEQQEEFRVVADKIGAAIAKANDGRLT